MSTTFKLALGAAAVIAVVLGGAFVLGPRPPDHGIGGRSDPLAVAHRESRRRLPSAAADLTRHLATWTTYTSSQYGFSIGHPADWTVDPASRAWTWDDAHGSPQPGPGELPQSPMATCA